MSHSDLESYSDRELENELERRQKLRRAGLCSYCRQPFESDLPCRYHERHVDRPSAVFAMEKTPVFRESIAD